jgi:transcriptional regulator with XRE-family HTH domain
VRLSFGEKMRVIMKRRGVSVQDLADRLGVSRQNVNQRLNADRFTLDDMEKYAAAIGCGIEIEIIEPQRNKTNRRTFTKTNKQGRRGARCTPKDQRFSDRTKGSRPDQGNGKPALIKMRPNTRNRRRT